MSIQALALDPSSPAPLFRAQAQAWTAGVMSDVVDQSLDRARELREKAEAERAAEKAAAEKRRAEIEAAAANAKESAGQ